MLSPIDYYMPAEMSVEEAQERQADYLEKERYDGAWEALIATYPSKLQQESHSKEWWAGFLTTLAEQNGIVLAGFTCYPDADEF